MKVKNLAKINITGIENLWNTAKNSGMVCMWLVEIQSPVWDIEKVQRISQADKIPVKMPNLTSECVSDADLARYQEKNWDWVLAWPRIAFLCIWIVNEQMRVLSLCLSLTLSLKKKMIIYHMEEKLRIIQVGLSGRSKSLENLPF